MLLSLNLKRNVQQDITLFLIHREQDQLNFMSGVEIKWANLELNPL
jgi:hypothetical protein